MMSSPTEQGIDAHPSIPGRIRPSAVEDVCLRCDDPDDILDLIQNQMSGVVLWNHNIATPPQFSGRTACR